MTGKARARSLVVAVLLVAGCARTGIELYPAGGSDETGGVGGRTGGGTSSNGAMSTGARPSGGRGASAGTSSTGGAATGGTSTGGAVGRGGRAGNAGTGGNDNIGRICPSLVAPDFEKVVLATILGDELWLYRSSGRGIRVNANAGNGSTMWRTNDYLVLTYPFEDALVVALVDREGNVLWSHRGPPDVLEPGEVFVNSQGDAAVRTVADPTHAGFGILANGVTRDLFYPPRGAPDADGWVPVGDGDVWGFVNVASAIFVRAPLAPSGSSPPFVWHDRLVYIAMDGQRPVVTVLTPSSEARIPLPLDLATARLVPTDVGALITLDSVPRGVVDVEHTGLAAGSSIVRNPSFEMLTATHGEWGLVLEGNVPRYSMNLRSGRVTELLPASLEPHGNSPLGVTMNDHFALVLGTSSIPAFWVSLEDARAEPIDATAFGSLRPFGSGCPTDRAALLDDGSIALGLRDNVTGGIYAGLPYASPWTLSGEPVQGVESIGVSVRSGAWIIGARAVGTSFCPAEDWPIPEPDALEGDSVQVILPDDEVLYQNTREEEFVFHESGLCALVRGIAHDFPTGTLTPIPEGASQLTFW